MAASIKASRLIRFTCDAAPFSSVSDFFLFRLNDADGCHVSRRRNHRIHLNHKMHFKGKTADPIRGPNSKWKTGQVRTDQMSGVAAPTKKNRLKQSGRIDQTWQILV